jgi:hypothetical protein
VGHGQADARNVVLRKAKAATVRTALAAAWRNVVPAKLAKRLAVK